ncbi:hypothetical protein [Clostridium sporogenes]|nr:hypothetical protein [Clostridium sporogenes]
MGFTYSKDPELGSVFSVNGSPGTDKITSLKKIIATHIVEKVE